MTTRQALTTMTTLTLPAGWQTWALGHRYLNISSPHGLLTIDLERRCFRPGGNNTTGNPVHPTVYRGRGWVQQLHAAAIAWLENA